MERPSHYQPVVFNWGQLHSQKICGTFWWSLDGSGGGVVVLGEHLAGRGQVGKVSCIAHNNPTQPNIVPSEVPITFPQEPKMLRSHWVGSVGDRDKIRVRAPGFQCQYSPSHTDPLSLPQARMCVNSPCGDHQSRRTYSHDQKQWPTLPGFLWCSQWAGADREEQPILRCQMAIDWMHTWPPKVPLTAHTARVSKHVICHGKKCLERACKMCQFPRGLFSRDKKLMQSEMVWGEWLLASVFRDCMGTLHRLKAWKQRVLTQVLWPQAVQEGGSQVQASYQSF